MRQLPVLVRPGHRLRELAVHRASSAGPPPRFTTAADYDRAVRQLLDAGVLVGEGTLFWYLRLSHRHPTLELRAPDVPLTAPATALLAILVRTLAAEAADAVAHGDPGPDPAPHLLRAAYWRAARDGVTGLSLDPVTGVLADTRTALLDLLARLRPHLGPDHALAELWLADVLAEGNGAVRQRAVGSPAAAVDHLLAHTAQAVQTWPVAAPPIR